MLYMYIMRIVYKEILYMCVYIRNMYACKIHKHIILPKEIWQAAMNT